MRKCNTFVFFIICKDGSFETRKIKDKQLNNNALEIENNFKLINISINDMDKFEKKKKKRNNKEENIYKKTLGMIGTTG